MLEDLTTDLLISDIFETMSSENQCKMVNGLEEAEQLIKNTEKNLLEIENKFQIKHVEKISHILFTIKANNTTFDLLIFPLIDQQFSQSFDKIKEWKAFKKVLKNEKLGDEYLQNQKIPCFLQTIKSKLYVKNIEIYSLIDSSETFSKNAIGFLKSLQEKKL